MANFSLNVSGAIGTGWEYAKKYGLLVTVIYLLVSVISSGIGSLFETNIDPSVYKEVGESLGRGDWNTVTESLPLMGKGSQTASSFIRAIIDLIVSVGLYNLALGLMNGRFNEVTFEAFKVPLATYLKVIAVGFITGFIILISFLLCLIPFFFITPRIVLAPVYQVDHPEAGVFESISASWNMTKSNTMSMLGLGFAVFGITILGFLCCCISVFFAQAIGLFILVGAYYQLKGNVE